MELPEEKSFADLPPGNNRHVYRMHQCETFEQACLEYKARHGVMPTVGYKMSKPVKHYIWWFPEPGQSA